VNVLVERLWSFLSPEPHAPLSIEGHGTLQSRYPVSDLAAASVAVAGLAARRGPVVVDAALADAWFGMALRPVGWELANRWDSLAGDYRTRDGWIRLHTNAPHHRRAALAVLGMDDVRVDRADVEGAVARWDGDELERAVVASGGAAAVLREPASWAVHPQGVTVADEPLIGWASTGTAEGEPGFAVLDLTRVLAGPVATRFLAGLGADVLRIDPPGWDEPAVVPEMTLGKRTARLDLTHAAGMRVLTRLIEQADVVVHGYRADALERLGVTSERLAEIKPGIVDVALNAYGWSGPWRHRRGFDSLVQMSTGIAWGSLPQPLPVQALDHATGYLAAAAALEGLHRRRATGRGQVARLSLARTALELMSAAIGPGSVPAEREHERAAELDGLPANDLSTPWGPARLLASPLTIGGEPLHWSRGPRPLGDEPGDETLHLTSG
jgi:hypothetical protein